MRIALDATPLVLTSGGLYRYVAELSLALATEFPQDEYTLVSDQNFEIPCAAANLKGLQGPVARRWWLTGVRRAIRACRAQIFHGTNFEVPLLPPVPSVLTIHDLSPWRNPAWHPGPNRVRNRTPWLLRLRRARRILTVSKAVGREVVSHFGVPPELVRSVPLAAARWFRPVEDAPLPERPYFLYVGTLEPRKNIAAAIECWAATRDRTGADLILVGRCREDFVPPQAREGLRLVGELPDADLPRLYSGALAFLYPTFYEGFGLPVLEAMSCGCPVITSQDPAVTEIAEHAAIHCADNESLARAMLAVSTDPELRLRMRHAGLARAANFSWARTARETRGVYTELLPEGPRKGAAA